MADPLSIAASVAGLLTLAAQTTKLIASIVIDIKKRQAELVYIQQEISSFCLVLYELERRLLDDTTDASTNEGLDTLLAGCKRTLQFIQELLTKIKDGHGKSGLSKIQGQLTYGSKMKSLEGLRSLLDKYKATLSIALLLRRLDTISISKMRENLRDVEEPVNRILTDTTIDPEEKQDQVALQQYVYSSAKTFAAKVSGTTSSLETPSTNISGAAGFSTEDDVFYGSFDEWLASFTPDMKGEETTPEQRLEFMREKRKKMNVDESCSDKCLEHNTRNLIQRELDPPLQKMRILIQGLRKKGSTVRYSETLEADPDSLMFELLQTLLKKGYTEICGFRSLDCSQTHFGPITGVKSPYMLRVTSGPSSFDPVSGYKINQHQRFIEFYNEYLCFPEKLDDHMSDKMREMQGSNIASCASFEVSKEPYRQDNEIILRDKRDGKEIPPTYISFQRTPRIPEDDCKNGNLPAQLGPFPLLSVASYRDNLSEEMIRMGGLFLHMLQREALSICFRGESHMEKSIFEYEPVKGESNYDFLENYAVRVYASAINVISGQRGTPAKKDASTQDFVVIPKQVQLDGFCVGNGLVKQFVAMPLGKGYSVEKQVSGQECIGGIQLEIAPRYKTNVLFARAKHARTGGPLSCPSDDALDTALDLFLTPSEAGFRPGQFLFMQLLDHPRRYRQTSHLKFDPSSFPEKEFFGTAPRKEDYVFTNARPTYLRELMAWAPDTTSWETGLKVDAVAPINVSITIPLSWDSRRLPGPQKSETAILRLSPFIDIRYISVSLLRTEAALQHVPTFPEHDIYNVKLVNPPKRQTPYTPLYSVNNGNIALYLEGMMIGCSGSYRMALGAGATRTQAIMESKDKRMFAWEKSLVVNIHILNSMTFCYATGFPPQPSPVSFREFAAARLPFYQDMGKGLEIEKGPLSLIKTVQKMDLDAVIVWDVVIAASGKCLIGCAYCETNLADTVLQPCNHVFCSFCITYWMVKGGRKVCGFCERKVVKTVVFGALTAIKSEGPPAAIFSEDTATERPEPSDVLAHLKSWGRARFGISTLAELFKMAISIADGRYGSIGSKSTNHFDFILANLWRLPEDLLKSKECVTLLAEGIYESVTERTGYCLDGFLKFGLEAREIDLYIPGKVGEILLRSLFCGERQALTLLDWACKDGHTLKDWGITFSSGPPRTSQRVKERMSELGAALSFANDDKEERSPKLRRGTFVPGLLET